MLAKEGNLLPKIKAFKSTPFENDSKLQNYTIRSFTDAYLIANN